MALTAQALSVGIAGKCVCENLNLSFKAGECWGVLGANGVGKSTLLLTLAGLRNATSGQVLIDDRNIAGLQRRRVATKLGILFQDSTDTFPATVLDTVLIGRHPHLGTWGWEGADDIALARAALNDVDLNGFEARYNSSLSGGERRRLAFATLLAQDPEIMLLDEPANHLDLSHQIDLLNLLLQRVKNRQHTVIMSLHDINLAARFCTHLLALCGSGETHAGPVRQMLDSALLERVFGHPLVCVRGDAGEAWLPAV